MLWWTVQNLVIAAVLACIASLVCWSSRVSPAARHALWLIVLLKLLTPPLVLWPWSIPSPWAEADHAARSPLAATALPAAAMVGAPHSPVLEANDALSEAASFPMPAERDNQSAALSTTNGVMSADPPTADPAVVAASGYLAEPVDWFSRGSFLAALAGIWLLGGLVFASLSAGRIVRLIRHVRMARPGNEDFREQLDELANRLRMPVIPMRHISGIGSPMIWSLARPMLLWPVGLSASLSPLARQALIVHELAHVRRRDHWVGWLELVASCVWWWNPLFWYIRYQLRENAELACDAWVAQTLPKSRRAYCEALLFVCERSSFLPAALTVGVSARNRKSLERRLTMIFRNRSPLKVSGSGMLAILVLLAAALPAWSQRAEEVVTESSGPPATARFAYERSTAEAAPARFTRSRLVAATEPLPADAQEVIQHFQQQQAEIQREADKKVADKRAELLKQLKEMQDRYTREARLDEAVAIRDQIRAMQVRTLGGEVKPDPGTLWPLRDRPEQTMLFEVIGSTDQVVWGTDVYTDDSSLATAAVHAGVLRPGQKGIVRVTKVPARQTYQSSTRNGVTSHAWGAWDSSYRVDAVDAPAATLTSPVSTWSSMQFYRGQTGQTMLIELVGATSGYVWGTDTYTDDSQLATAAVHAGVLKPGERGTVQVEILPGRASYEGTTRNGVTSYPYESWGGSYRFHATTPTIRPTSRIDRTRLPLNVYSINPAGLPVVISTPLGISQGPSLSRLHAPGSVLYVDLVGSTSGYVWGTDVYTADSSLAAAAVHAGALRDGESGRIKVTFVEGRDRYSSSVRNGVMSQAWDAYPGSFRVERSEGPPGLPH